MKRNKETKHTIQSIYAAEKRTEKEKNQNMIWKLKERNKRALKRNERLRSELINTHFIYYIACANDIEVIFLVVPSHFVFFIAVLFFF